MRRLLLMVGLVLSASNWADAQDSVATPPTETIEPRAFDAERIAAYQADPDLDYDRDLRREPSLWDRFKEWFWWWLEKMLGNRVTAFVMDNLFYIITAVMIVVVIIILSRHGLRGVFHGAPRSAAQVSISEEDIREMDLPMAIREAEQAGDLRRAIRLHYLLVLRQLVDQGVLRWSPERTDRDYMAQIADPALRARFAHVALIFQWVWYGHAEVDRERYDSIRRPFIQFEQAPAR
ncbi:MAG: DUF4129 domain-containing protein [Flavobacteriales bacterium]|nr:DUF4129 domain-containing protein [Flavobacteriales bacterium]